MGMLVSKRPHFGDFSGGEEQGYCITEQPFHGSPPRAAPFREESDIQHVLNGRFRRFLFFPSCPVGMLEERLDPDPGTGGEACVPRRWKIPILLSF